MRSKDLRLVEDPALKLGHAFGAVVDEANSVLRVPSCIMEFAREKDMEYVSEIVDLALPYPPCLCDATKLDQGAVLQCTLQLFTLIMPFMGEDFVRVEAVSRRPYTARIPRPDDDAMKN
jgi:hypothetical protein